MVAFTVEKLDYGPLLFVLKGASGHCNYRTSWVPFDLAQNHAGIHSNRVVILVILHEDQSSLLIRNAKSDWSLFRVHDRVFVPVDSCQGNAWLQEILRLHDPLEPRHCDLVQKLAVFVVYEDLAF